MEEEWAKLVGDDEVEDLEIALEEAFESGIAAAFSLEAITSPLRRTSKMPPEPGRRATSDNSDSNVVSSS